MTAEENEPRIRRGAFSTAHTIAVITLSELHVEILLMKRPCTLLLTAMIVLTPVEMLVAGDPSSPSETQIRSWIQDLANASPARHYRDPEDRLTHKEQQSLKPVRRAYLNLTRHFMAALPILIENIEDPRFSYPQEHPSSGVFENRSAGHACRSIIERKLLLENPMVIDARGIAVWYHFPVSRDWYQQAHGKSLYALQVEALDWLLRQPAQKQVRAEDWQQALKRVQEYRDQFVQRGQAVDKESEPAITGK
jgi:hypothetical protein